MKNKYAVWANRGTWLAMMWLMGVVLTAQAQTAPSAVTLTQPAYNCATGVIIFTSVGGDGSPITYAAPGVTRALATSGIGVVEQGLRNDPKPIMITATQGGFTDSYTFNFGGYCTQSLPPIVRASIPDFTFTVGVSQSPRAVEGYFSTQTPLNTVQFVASGLPPGLTFSDGSPQQGSPYAYFGGTPTMAGVYTVTVTATNTALALPNNSASATFKITVVDPPVVNPPTTPPTSGGGTLTVVQPFYNCQTGAITFFTTGGDGSPITYKAPGITRSSASSKDGTVEQGLRNDPKPITITATQNGYSTNYTFDLAVYCNTALPPVLLSPIPDYTVAVGTGVFEYINQYFSRQPSSPVVFSAVGLPKGLSFSYIPSLQEGLFAGVPSATGVYTVTVTATNPVLSPPTNSVSTTFKITVVDPTVVNPPTPPTGTGGTLALTQPIYNCATGAITFNTTGGNGSPITYNAPGISRTSITDNSGTVEQGLRNDPKPIAITATQSGQTVSYTFDFGAYCGGTQPRKTSPIFSTIPDRTFTVGQVVDGYPPGFPIGSGYYNSKDPNNYRTWSISASGVPPGLYLLSGVVSGTFFYAGIAGKPTEAGTYPVVVTAVDPLFPDSPFISRFTITVVSPSTGGALTLLAPTYDCATGAITFRSSGGNGSPVEYRAVGITDWTTNPNQSVDRESRTANDVQPFMLMARQNGVTTTYVWDLKVACGRARQGVSEQVAELSVSVLGNPVSDAVTVEVRGADGQPLSLRLLDSRGRLVESRTVEQAGSVERQRFALPSSGPGLLLLRVSSGTRSQTVKIIRQ